jgi:rhamnosyltransferase
MSGSTMLIVLSSYNGEQFITEQINSIRKQSFTDWTLLVRDDGSSDRTIPLVQALAEQDDRIRLLDDTQGRLGPAASFGVLLARARDLGAPYVALSDQDDVWLPTKLARELERLKDQEAVSGTTTPLLIHSDLAVVREDLTLLHRSFLEFQGLQHQAQLPLRTLLIQNFVTGSTVVLNRALLECAVPVPRVIMHDWWLALCAAASGRLLYLPEATVLYRQHRDNAQGSQGRRTGVFRAVRRPFTWWTDSAAMLARAVDQARELGLRLERIHPEGSPARNIIQEFCSAFMPGRGALERVRVVYRHRIQPRSFWPYPVPFFTRVLLWAGDPQSHAPGVTSRSDSEPHHGAPARPDLGRTTSQ